MPLPSFRPDGWLPTGHHATTWDEVVAIFGGPGGSRRRMVTDRLLWLRDGLRRYGVRGSLLLDGSYVSAKLEPGDFDVMLIAQPGIDALKEGEPNLADMLDPIEAERNGYSMLYAQTDSPVLPLLRTIWDRAKDGVTEKGVVEVRL